MPVSLGNNHVSLTPEQPCQHSLGTTVRSSPSCDRATVNNCATLTWEQSCQSHSGTIESLSFGKSQDWQNDRLTEFNVSFFVTTQKINNTILGFNAIKHLLQSKTDIKTMVSILQTVLIMLTNPR